MQNVQKSLEKNPPKVMPRLNLLNVPKKMKNFIITKNGKGKKDRYHFLDV